MEAGIGRQGWFLPGACIALPTLVPGQARAAHDAGRLRIIGITANAPAFAGYLGPRSLVEWVVYAKAPSPAPRRCSPIAATTASPSAA